MRVLPIRFGLTLLAVVIPTAVARAASFTLTPAAVVPNAVVVTYNPADGNLSFDSNGTRVATIELKSRGEQFDPFKINPGVIVHGFDVMTSARFFIYETETFGITSVDIGPILPAGLTAELLLADMQIDGSFHPGPPYLSLTDPLVAARISTSSRNPRASFWRAAAR